MSAHGFEYDWAQELSLCRVHFLVAEVMADIMVMFAFCESFL